MHFRTKRLRRKRESPELDSRAALENKARDWIFGSFQIKDPKFELN